MILPTWFDFIRSSLFDVMSAVFGFMPLLIGSVAVFLIGWMIASGVGKLVEHLIKASRVDSLLQTLEFEKALERGGFKLNSGAFIGGLVKWFLIIAFMLASVNILGERFAPISDFLKQVLIYLPNVIVAAMILVIAALVSEVSEKLVKGSVSALGFKSSMAGVAIRWSIWIFGIIAALLQLGIAVDLLRTVITGVIAMLSLAFGLAFGLGGKDAAADIIAKARRDMGGQ